MVDWSELQLAASLDEKSVGQMAERSVAQKAARKADLWAAWKAVKLAE
jgi:hypothetical protein